ncbi:AEC family transporter [Lentilactobacillus sp. Marseille-Q4993]|uniref:AEC family transporter n=1 Tax=Lentilactobacillus sp. Marseille-Q4993 TaxID=3039492 RepID=UPI0024BBF91D|nr:AEC family transporter [Lentilactobacillus sp. Marseille-Q4993]
MVSSLVSALLPIVVTLLLGYYAASKKDFSGKQAGWINKLVLNYTLPLSLFGGVLSTNRDEIFSRLDVAVWTFAGMAGGFIIVYLIAKYGFHQTKSLATLHALTIAGPAVPFIGPTILGTLFPHDSALLVTIGGLVMNIVQIPIAVMLLSSDSADSDVSGFQIMKDAFKKPVAWAPVLAFALSMLGVQIAPQWQRVFSVLGNATGGLALFASGVILYSERPSFSKAVWVNALSKNILLPLIIFGFMILFKSPKVTMDMALMTLGIPTAAISTIFANQYHVAEREMASTLSLSTFMSVISLGLMMLARGI